MPNKSVQRQSVQPSSKTSSSKSPASDYSLTNPTASKKGRPFADDFNFEHTAFMAAARNGSQANAGDFIGMGALHSLPSCVFLG